ncbi:MAG TPA: HAMP domain-containing protein, partial [Burkholderiaceae bacterium]
MKLKHKIPGVFAGALALSLAAGLGSVLVVDRSLSTIRSDVMRQVDDERAITSLSGHFKAQLLEWKDTLLRGSDVHLLDKHWNGFLRQQQAVAEGAQALRGRLDSAELNAELERFVAARRRMAEGYAQGFDKFKATGFDSSVGDMAVRGIDDEPARLLDDLAARIAERRNHVAAQAFDAGVRAIGFAVAVMVGAGVLGLALGLALGRRVVRPLLSATQVARAVAVGDLARRIEVEGDDETAALLRALAEMQAQLRGVVGSVRESASSVEDASAGIAQGNVDLSRRTGQQSSALQVTASTMEQLGATASNS